MPSLDGMGRYYPLTLHAIADAGAPIPPPDIDTLDEWFGVAESFLLSTLARDAAFDDISQRLDGLAVPRTRSRAAADTSIVSLGDDMAGMVMAGTEFRDDAVGASGRQPRGLCCRKLLVDGRRRRFSSAGIELPRFAGPIPLFHVADRRSGVSRRCEVRFAKCRLWSREVR